MKVELNGAYRAYAQNSAVTPQNGDRRKAEEPVAKGQQDRVSISQSAYKGELAQLAGTTASEIEQQVSTARIGELRQAVAAGRYHVPAEKLSEALLSAYV